jgi:hypothetical protein
MNINTTDTNSPSGFYAVPFDTYTETLAESSISYSIDMGAVTIHHGTRQGQPIWLMDNPGGKLYGIWLEDAHAAHLH